MTTLEHAIKIAAARDTVFEAFTEISRLSGWHIGSVKGEVEVGKTLTLTHQSGMQFSWRTDELIPAKKITQVCVDGPGSSIGKTLTILLSDESDGRTFVRLSDAGWRDDDEHLPLCNTYWGTALSQLRIYLEKNK